MGTLQASLCTFWRGAVGRALEAALEASRSSTAASAAGCMGLYSLALIAPAAWLQGGAGLVYRVSGTSSWPGSAGSWEGFMPSAAAVGWLVAGYCAWAFAGSCFTNTHL
jgi:hypothetical protein